MQSSIGCLEIQLHLEYSYIWLGISHNVNYVQIPQEAVTIETLSEELSEKAVVDRVV